MPADTLFNDQALVILKNPSRKPSSSSEDAKYENLINANEVIAILRNPEGQIYFAEDLHSHIHFTLGLPKLETMAKVRKDVPPVQIIRPTDNNVIKDDFFVWNKDGLPGDDNEGFNFLSVTKEMIKDIFPGFSEVMKKPSNVDTRGTIATTLGFTTTDCNQYADNRSTILETVCPYLVKVVSTSTLDLYFLFIDL